MDEPSPVSKNSTVSSKEDSKDGKYVLTQDLLTGNELIDSEHRKIFDEVNTLSGCMLKRKGKRKDSKSGRELLC